MGKFRVVGLVVLMMIIAAVCRELYVSSHSDSLAGAAGAAGSIAALGPGTPGSVAAADAPLMRPAGDNTTTPAEPSAPSAGAPAKDMPSRAAAPPASKEFSSPYPVLPVTTGSPMQLNGQLPATSIDKLDFLDARTGWIIQTNGDGTESLLATINGGMDWETRVNFRDIDIMDMHFVTASFGWASASADCTFEGGTRRCPRMRLLNTSDGGLTWETVGQWDTTAGGAFVALDELHVQLIAGAAMISTRDGGHTWREIWFGEEPFEPDRLSFVSPDKGWIIGRVCQPQSGEQGAATCKLTVLSTRDGGAHWTKQYESADASPSERGADIRFIDEKRGWFLSSDYDTMKGGLFATTDGGRHWEKRQELRSARPAPVKLDFISPDFGWIPLDTGAGPIEGGIMATEDGGRHFETLGVDQGWSIQQSAVISAAEGWAINWHRELIHTADGGRTWEQRYPKPRPEVDLTFVDPLNGFGIGRTMNSNTLVTTSDGGASWRTVNRFAEGDAVVAVTFADTAAGWALVRQREGDGIVLLHTDDGGRSWEKVASAPTVQDNTARPYIRFFSLQNGVIVTKNNDHETVYSTQDGGVSWEEAEHPVIGYGGGDQFSFLSSAEGWTYQDKVPASGAALFHTADGKEWSPVGALPAQGWAYAIHFLTEQKGRVLYQHNPFTMGNSWSMLCTDDGGKTWMEHPFPAEFKLDERWVKLHFTDDKHGWLLTGAGILHTVDGGTVWTWQTS